MLLLGKACMAFIVLRITNNPQSKSAWTLLHLFSSLYSSLDKAFSPVTETLPHSAMFIVALNKILYVVKCDWWVLMLSWPLLAVALLRNYIYTTCSSESAAEITLWHSVFRNMLEHLREKEKIANVFTLMVLCNFSLVFKFSATTTFI